MMMMLMLVNVKMGEKVVNITTPLKLVGSFYRWYYPFCLHICYQ